ncbi:chymotrypsin inhibitor SCI-III-like [Bombyx mandarina]|uniref:BPTI/Kunitz inhibitor domain-containing protein n=2 Tax=Bombyx TaxID=7090 RepID=A0A8R2HTD2_BOMMO|nr:chymotrypsin inhibitor SCI-III-like [Bombyx mori]XP_028033791.1 chymotrypsin inhibitor SCI-III-like [Bombyx mandarina]
MLRSVLFLTTGVFFAAIWTSVTCDEPYMNLPKCMQPFGITGLCMASIQSYTYNQGTKKCEIFIYGGCGGSKNRFNTITECENECLKT